MGYYLSGHDGTVISHIAGMFAVVLEPVATMAEERKQAKYSSLHAILSIVTVAVETLGVIVPMSIGIPERSKL